MLRNLQNFRRCLLPLLLGCALGCAREPAPTAVDSSPAAAISDTTKQTPSPMQVKNARAARVPKSTAKETVAAPPTNKFVGPFPHRTNPFAMPTADKAATVAQQRSTEKRVEERLLGFVNVNGRRALLQIDGKVWAAQQGESRNGIEVVEIAPAHVTLRRDGNTWNLPLARSG